MTRRSQLGGSSRVTSLPCGILFAGFAQTLWPSISTATGACTAGVAKTILNVTGSKIRLNACVLQQAGISSLNHRIKIWVDGALAFDSLDFANNTSNTYSWVAVGQVVGGTTSSVLFQPVDALTSLKIEYISSVTTGSSLANIVYNYEVRQ